MARSSNNEPPQFPIETEAFVSTLAQVAAGQGDAPAVAVLATSEATIEHSDTQSDWGRQWDYYTLRLFLDPGLYARLGAERAGLTERLASLARELSEAHREDEVIGKVALAPAIKPMDGWRPRAQAWLRGEGINNQGRVRSDNVAPHTHEGLLFRSQPEIYLYDALKRLGLYLAPLPVFVRGGANYQRLEPDFVLVHRGVLMVVEVDGATVHRESPAEAHARTQGLQREGVLVERVQAADCATPEKARACADALMAALDAYRGLRT